MILTVDIGNTNIMFCSFKKSKILKVLNINIKNLKFDQDLFKELNFLFPVKDIFGIAISSVVPNLNDKIIFFFESYYKVKPSLISNIFKKFKLKTFIKKKKEIGIDRVINVIYANELVNSSSLIIDFGTATTIDFINSDSVYEGGIIAPGIDLSLTNLNKFTAKLPLVKFKRTKSVIGNSTKNAIKSGFFWGYICMINGLIKKIILEKRIKPKIFLTGGNSILFDDYINNIYLVDKFFTMRGINFVYRRINNDI